MTGSWPSAGIDLVVGPGEIYGLVGPNGAGKTTTMRILATLLAPTAGEALVCGIDVTADPVAVRRLIGYMPDFFGVYDDMRVWEYLDFFARCYECRLGAADRHDRRAARDRRPDRQARGLRRGLSRGMRQRLCLAHTLVHDPQLLILDEPASGLDPRARVEMREILRELRGMGKTILVSSHILPELAELCTSVGIIDHGGCSAPAAGRDRAFAPRHRAAADRPARRRAGGRCGRGRLGTDARVMSVLAGDRGGGPADAAGGRL